MTCERLSLEQTLFGLAGAMTALGVALAALVSPWFLVLAGFVAVNQLLFAFTGECGASLVLRRTPCFARKVTT